MSAKKVSFGTKPKSAAASVDEWVETRTTNSQQGQETSQVSDLPPEASEKLKRLTLDIPETLGGDKVLQSFILQAFQSPIGTKSLGCFLVRLIYASWQTS